MNKDIDADFEVYISALADILLEHYDEAGLDVIPASMREWRADIADSTNELAEWFVDNLIITGNI